MVRGDPLGAQADIPPDGAGEQVRVLEHDAEMAAQVGRVEFADVDAAHADRPALHIVEAQQGADQGSLARAGVAHNSEGLAGTDAEAHVAQHPVLALVGEPYLVELDRLRAGGKGPENRRRGDFDLRIEQAEDALGRSRGRLQKVVLLAQVLDGPEKPHAELEKRHQHAGRRGAFPDAEATIGEHQPQPEHGKELHRRKEPAVRDDGVLEGFHMGAIDPLELLRALPLAVEELEDRHAGQVLLEISVDACDGHADTAIALAGLAAERDGHYHHGRQDGCQRAGQRRVEFQHHREDKGQHEHIAENGDEARGQQFVESIHVGGDAGQHAPYGGAVIERQVEALKVRHQVAAQGEHGLLSGPLHEVGLREV